MKTTGKKILMGVMILALALCQAAPALATSYYITPAISTSKIDDCLWIDRIESGSRPEEDSYGTTLYGIKAGGGIVPNLEYDSAFGYDSYLAAGTQYATAIGAQSHAWASLATAIGANSYAGENSTALGYRAHADSSKNGVALGANSYANGDYSVALGANSVTAGENEVSVGYYNSDTDKLYRKITNVAAGNISHTSTDAVNASQLQDTRVNSMSLTTRTEDNHKILTVNLENGYYPEEGITDSKSVDLTELIKDHIEIKGALGNVSTSNGIVSTKTVREEGGVKYVDIDMHMGDDFRLTDAYTGNYTDYTSNGVSINGKTYVSDAGLNANDKAIKNVAAGELSATSTEAVNGSQLYATNQQVATNTNAIAVINASDPMNSGITAAKVDKYEKYVTESGLNANGNKITNVAAGELSATSTDAVNGSQLYNAVAETNKEIQEVGAMSAALAGLHYMEPSGEGDDKVTGAVSYGGYRSENAAAVGIAYKPNQNLMFSASTSIGNSQQAYNAGMSFRFGKGKTTNRAEMAKQIKYLSEENTELKTTVKVLLERMEQLEKKLK